MAININPMGNSNYPSIYNVQSKADQKVTMDNKEELSKTVESDKIITPEEKIQMANQFWAEHDAEYAKSQAEILGRIGEGMAVAQEISRRMSSGAKVSQSDESNLMQYDMRMYMAAKNAQLMAQRKEDMSNESLIDEYVEKHKNDQKDFVSGELEKVKEMQEYTVIDSNQITQGVSNTGTESQGVSVDISI